MKTNNEEKYPVNTRVEYAYEPKLTLNGNRIKGQILHRVGFVKRITRTWWGAKRYLICSHNNDVRTIDVVAPHMIFGAVENKKTSKHE